jgi:hypothetical protein
MQPWIMQPRCLAVQTIADPDHGGSVLIRRRRLRRWHGP